MPKKGKLQASAKEVVDKAKGVHPLAKLAIVLTAGYLGFRFIIVPLWAKATEFIDIKNKISILFFDTPRIQDLSWTNAKIALPVRFQNNSTINVPVENITCSIALANAAGTFSDIGADNFGSITLVAGQKLDKEFMINISSVSTLLAVFTGSTATIRAKFEYSAFGIPQVYAQELKLTK